MLPHSRKDAKLDTKNNLHYLNEVAELYNCNGVLFFEARKRQDLYIWMSRVPNGPCVKFHVHNCKFSSSDALFADEMSKRAYPRDRRPRHREKLANIPSPQCTPCRNSTSPVTP